MSNQNVRGSMPYHYQDPDNSQFKFLCSGGGLVRLRTVDIGWWVKCPAQVLMSKTKNCKMEDYEEFPDLQS